MPLDWRPFVEVVRAHESFVLTSHMRPDCDAIGSELALALALRTLGKKVQIVNGDIVPPHIGFIDPENDVSVLGRDVQEADVRPDVLVVLDTSAWAQLGPMVDVVRNSTAVKIVIDHHASHDDLGATAFKDVESEATGRLVLAAIDALGVAVTPEMAAPLFAAIATDTGWFRFNSVTALTFAAVGRLVHSGAKPATVFAALYERNTLARLHLQGRILSVRDDRTRRPADLQRRHAARPRRDRGRGDRYRGRGQPAVGRRRRGSRPVVSRNGAAGNEG